MVCARRLAVRAMSIFSPSNNAKVGVAHDNTFLHGFTARWIPFFNSQGYRSVLDKSSSRTNLRGWTHGIAFWPQFLDLLVTRVLIHTRPR